MAVGLRSDQKADDVARTISGWLNTQPSLSDRITSGLLKSLEEAGDYFAAEAAGKALDAVGTLTAEQWEAVDAIFLSNNKVGESILARRALDPLYSRSGRAFPRKSA